MLSIYLLLYRPYGTWLFLQFLNLYTVWRTPWMGVSQSQGRCLNTEQHKNRLNAHRHPWLEWDSNPRSQGSSRRRGHAVNCSASVIGLHVVSIAQMFTIRLSYLILPRSMFTARQSRTSIHFDARLCYRENFVSWIMLIGLFFLVLWPCLWRSLLRYNVV
jgi:hypothetical protein